MDNILIWNARGVGNTLTFRVLSRLIRSSRPRFLAILEPMIRDSRRAGFGLKLGFHSSLSNIEEGGKIWLFYNTDLTIQISVLSSSNQLLSILVCLQNPQLSILLSFVYTKCSRDQRKALWDDISATNRVFHGPWAIGGDFNSVIDSTKRLGCRSFGAASVADFRDAIDCAGLNDAGFEGKNFTWSNNRNRTARVWARLNWVLINADWQYKFPTFKVTHLPRVASDHAPLLLTAPPQLFSGPKLFHFQRMWSLHDDFLQVKQVATKVNELENQMQHTHGQEDIAELNEAKKELARAELLEEVFWKQKSRNRCLLEGDRNTKFFHSIANARVRKAGISTIKTDQGISLFDPDFIKAKAFRFFQEVFSSTTGWPILANDLLKTATSMLAGSPLPRAFKSTLICLIPKTEAANKFSDFHPIALCNCINKIFIKIIATRLNKMLPKIISQEQGAFVKGRAIAENITLTQEMIREINRKVQGGNVLLKLDMEKAYDWVEWDFPMKILFSFSFSASLSTLLESCWKSNWFSILINGVAVGYFQSTRGIRQGDLISPALFTIASEALSRGFRWLVDSRLCLPFALHQGSPLITYQLFADDTVLFLNGSKSSFQVVSSILQKFQDALGQKFNFRKSFFLCSNRLPPTRIKAIEDILSIKRVLFTLGFRCCRREPKNLTTNS
ncbi:uncharacterized protein LOC131224290 [Magnolia sinica]|uniref:uncharacterized protein LOC131224290 n=1 Tax=Magnolia sinica TaxID=86752 RepID=UPI00265B337B|nr:uncharacterized protein LOC131224290 [Magnolia sinica]